MQNIEKWCNLLGKKLKKEFAEQLYFFGLQGSYRRGEATEDSDIDVVVIFKTMDLDILCRYRKILDTMPDAQKVCGFVAGEKELENWPTYDLLQLLYDTKPFYGSLQLMFQYIDRTSIEQAVKIEAANLYHMACHSFLFGGEQRVKMLSVLYKQGQFMMRTYALFYKGIFASNMRQVEDLLPAEALSLYRHWRVAKISIESEENIINKEYEKIIFACKKILEEI